MGLQQQEERIIGLVEGLGVKVEQSVRRGKGKGKTGRLVDTGDEEEEVDPFSLGFVESFAQFRQTSNLAKVAVTVTMMYHWRMSNRTSRSQ